MVTSKIWTKNFVALTIANFLSVLAFYLLMVAVTGYSVEAFGVDLGTAALAVSLYIIGSLIGRFFLGKKIDAWGFKRSLMTGYAASLVFCVFYFLPVGWVPFLFIRFLHGWVFALQSAAGATAAACLLPVERRGEGIGYFAMFQAVGTAIGPFFAALFVGEEGGFQLLFVMMTVLNVIVVLLGLLIKNPGQSEAKKNEMPSSSEISAVQASNAVSRLVQQALCFKAIPISLVMMLLYVSYGSVLSYMLDFAATIDAAEGAKLFFLAYAGCTVIGRLFCGKLVDTKGPHVVLPPVLVVATLSLFVFSFAYGDVMLLVGAAMMGFGVGTAYSTIQAAIAKMVPQNQLGRANSTLLLSLDIGSGIGPLIFGAIMGTAGYGVSWFIMGILAVITVAYYLIIRKNGLAG